MAPNRIFVVGDTSSGKSTLAEALAAALGSVFVEMDALFWLPEWQQRPVDEFRAMLDAALPAGGRWVAAGNYRSHAQPLWPRADAFVWLDLPLRVTLPRGIARTWRRWRTRELLWGTNRERLYKQFMLWDQQQSLFAYSLANHRRKRARLEAALRDPTLAHAAVLRITRPAPTADLVHRTTSGPAFPTATWL